MTNMLGSLGTEMVAWTTSGHPESRAGAPGSKGKGPPVWGTMATAGELLSDSVLYYVCL